MLAPNAHVQGNVPAHAGERAIYQPLTISPESYPVPYKSKRIRDTKRKHKLISELAKRHGWICWACGQDVSDTSPIKPRLAHITPLARGGTNHFSNLGLFCECCDRAQGSLDLQTLLHWLHRSKNSVFAVKP